MTKAVAKVEAEKIDTDQDRYPTLRQALWAINQVAADLDGHVERVEVTCLANGEANSRWWAPRADEPEVVHIPDARSG